MSQNSCVSILRHREEKIDTEKQRQRRETGGRIDEDTELLKEKTLMEWLKIRMRTGPQCGALSRCREGFQSMSKS